MTKTTRFKRVEFSNVHLEQWRRAAHIKHIYRIEYTKTEAIVYHT